MDGSWLVNGWLIPFFWLNHVGKLRAAVQIPPIPPTTVPASAVRGKSNWGAALPRRQDESRVVTPRIQNKSETLGIHLTTVLSKHNQCN